MNEELKKHADACYQLSSDKALRYFQLLYEKTIQQSYVPTLIKDFEEWKDEHQHRRAFLSYFSRVKEKANARSYHSYIQWLNVTGKLDRYLDRSISYIFLRDLGKALDSTETLAKVRKVVKDLKKYLLKITEGENDSINELSLLGLYRKAQQEGIESTFIWVINKINSVTSNIPKGMDAEEAKRKLIKIIFGVLLHEIEGMGEDILPEERTKKLDQAIRLGYSYGLTYPFIDDLLDANILSDKEKKHYADLIRITLITGIVPEVWDWSELNREFIHYVHLELREAFEYIREYQREESRKLFLDEAYVFFQSQEEDRIKVLSNPKYTNEELYIPIILKSSSSRLMARSIISSSYDEGFKERTFYYGIYNQLADDFTDLLSDLQANAVTPYTYYLMHHEKRHDLINPFELYWTVISHLIHDVYHSDPKTREVILSRAINGLKRFKDRMGTDKYHELMTHFAPKDQSLNHLIQTMVKKADDVDFFDKLLRDHIITRLKNQRHEMEMFFETIQNGRNVINKLLSIPVSYDASIMKDDIIHAANYSLKADGKRLRPIMTWVMGIQEYGLDSASITPLLRSLEYMHTASLIFDDLPSQDNASTRRGQRTLHQVYNVATAELTGLFLTQKAVEEQASLHSYDSKTVLHLIRYSTQVVENVCRGQSMDLRSKGKPLTLNQLNKMCFYKTGIAFEAALIMPAILAHREEGEMKALKDFSYHAGIAFQIKDDLLDVEGNVATLGKPVGKDLVNNNSTFVSILGKEGAKRAMWEHYGQGMEALQNISLKTNFLKHLLHYMINRNH